MDWNGFIRISVWNLLVAFVGLIRQSEYRFEYLSSTNGRTRYRFATNPELYPPRELSLLRNIRSSVNKFQSAPDSMNKASNEDEYSLSQTSSR
jgi:hypothetical protein